MLTGEEIDKVDYIARTYKNMIYRICSSYLLNPQDSEDAVQLIFIKIMRYIDKIDNPSSNMSKSYIYRIAHTTALDFSKVRGRVVTFPYDETVFIIEEKNVIETLAKAIAEDCWDEITQDITELDKTILVFKYGQKFQSKEIAQMLNMTDSAIRQRLSRVIKHLASNYISTQHKHEEVKNG